MAAAYYGVCRLAVVSVRNEPRHSAQQLTQLLFGDHYEVSELSADKLWARIRVYTDGSEGWIDFRQHHNISEEYFQQINQTEYKITTEVASTVLYKKLPMTIVMGSIVPISSSELFKIEEQFAFNGESKNLGQRRDAEFVRQIARKYLSAPYQWGGKSPFGIDHTGLIQMAFRIAGYPLPRQLKELLTAGKPVASPSEAQAGDVAFFTMKGSTPTHCGILDGEERVIHAHGMVRLDAFNEEGILVQDTKIFTHFLHSIRRIVG